MKLGFSRVLPLVAMVALTACAPGGPGSRSDSGQLPRVDQSRTLRIVVRVEPESVRGEGSQTKTIIPLRMFTAGLSRVDSREAPYPVLAETLPQLNTDTWKLFPDGRMETIYRLRPGLTWHDGTPLLAEDFTFSLRAFKTETRWGRPPVGSTDDRKSGQFMDEIVPLDPQTILIQWQRTYPDAGNLPFPPRPRHLLEAIVDQDDPDVWYGLDYWRGGYIGAGPYRMLRWEPGSYMEGAAFEGYALGRPKIDRIVVTFSEKPPVTVARLLSDDVDMALSESIQFEQMSVLKEQWMERTQARFLLSPLQMRYVAIQQKPEYADPPALMDVRVRRSLMHAIDRSGLAEAMLGENGVAADTMVPPGVGFYPAVDRAITKYPFDVRRTEQLMAEVGYTKGAADGFFASPTAGRFSPAVWGVADGQDAQETTIVADYLKRAGIDSQLWLYPESNRVGSKSDEFKVTFPALNDNNNSLSPPTLGIEKFTRANLATPQNNFRGTNHLGWTNPEYDRLVDGFFGTLDAKEGEAMLVRALVILSQEIPMLPLYPTFAVDAHVGSLHGPEAATPSSTRYYNVHLWEWR